MRLRSKKSAFLVVWLLLLVLPSLIGAGVAAQAGQATPAQYAPEEAAVGASLQIRIRSDEGAQYPPGDLLLSDPSARMSGSDARTTYREIPGAIYTQETLSPRQYAFLMDVANAVSGNYSLRVIGVDYGKYYLSMAGFDQTGARADISFTALLQPGEVHHYLINYSNRDGARIRARRTPAVE